MSALADIALEEELLAAVMLTPSSLRTVLVDEHLRPEHFAGPATSAAFEAIVALSDGGSHVDPVALAAALEHDERVPDSHALAQRLAVPPLDLASSPASRAQRLRSLHRRRQLRQAAELLIEAAEYDDQEKVAAAESLLTSPEEAEQTTWSPAEIRERYLTRMRSPLPEAWSWPFSKMNDWTGGGLRRQQIVLIGGWTAAGKSIVYDQILEHLAAQGLRVHSYINEMSEAERTDRTIARLSGVPFDRVHRMGMTGEEFARIEETFSREIRVGLTECAGWSAAEIARHIRWNRWDVAGVDILHEIAHREERDLAEIAQLLRTTAKSVGCALIACVHLNDNRVNDVRRPVPVLRDVRGSGMLVRGADIVLFVHRDDDERGIPQTDGTLFAAKIRNGRPGGMKVEFQPSRMRFLPRAEDVYSEAEGVRF